MKLTDEQVEKIFGGRKSDWYGWLFRFTTETRVSDIIPMDTDLVRHVLRHMEAELRDEFERLRFKLLELEKCEAEWTSKPSLRSTKALKNEDAPAEIKSAE